MAVNTILAVRDRVKLGALLLLVTMLGLVCLRMFWWGGHRVRQSLPDGSAVILSGAKIGSRVEFVHGTLLERMIGQFAPSNGLKILNFTLNRPEKRVFQAINGHEDLVVKFQFIPKPHQQARSRMPQFDRQYRMIVSGDDGFIYCAAVDKFEQYSTNEVVGFAALQTFPRGSRNLHFRLAQRGYSNSDDWRELGAFTIANPKRARDQSWTPVNLLKFELSSELILEIGEVTVEHERINPTDIWETMATVPFRVIRDGKLDPNWRIQDGEIQDSSGNYNWLYNSERVITNGWVLNRTHRPLDPSKLWRFKVHLASDTNFPASVLHSFDLNFPISGTMKLESAGLPFEMTSLFEYLNIKLANEPADKRMLLVSVTDLDGEKLDSWAASWGQHAIRKGLNVTGSGKTPIHVTVAVVPDYVVEFTTLPRLKN